MEFLSLKQPRPLAARRLTRAEGILLSLLLHVLLFLLVLYLPGHLPASVISFFRPRPPGPAAASAAEVAASPALSSDHPLEKPKIPLKFAYVKVPEDRAVEKNPTSPYFLGTLGCVCYGSQRYAEAMKYLEKALELHFSRADSSTDLYFAAMTAYRLDQKERARNLLERAEQLEPSNRYREIARRLIAGRPSRR